MTDHTAAMRGSLTPEALRAVADEISARAPAARLIKNRVGDLSILDGETYVGNVELISGDVCWWGETD